MSTVKEVEARVRKEKKINKDLLKQIEEKDLHIKFLTDRLDNWAEKNAELREKIRSITVDDVVALQKSKADFFADHNLGEQLEKQEQVILNSSGITNE